MIYWMLNVLYKACAIRKLFHYVSGSVDTLMIKIILSISIPQKGWGLLS
jgi:hypothetical protein